MSTLENSRAYRAEQDREQKRAAREWANNNKEFLHKVFTDKEFGQIYRRAYYLGLAEGETEAYNAAIEQVRSEALKNGVI